MKKWHGVTKVACDHIIWRGHPRQGSDAINDHKEHTKKAKHEKRFKNFGAKNFISRVRCFDLTKCLAMGLGLEALLKNIFNSKQQFKMELEM